MQFVLHWQNCYTLYKKRLDKPSCSTKKNKKQKFSTSVYREAMALPAQILDIPQRLAEINVEIQNVENSLRKTRIMLNGFLRHLRSVNPAAIEARMEASRQRIRELEERLQGLRQEQQALIVEAIFLGAREN
ncbi:hypothetical protein NitaMp138 (mitochondrion) [Nicotiana tabacum]|uniref:Uncharacterized protein n=1 Tax=Nicotiana tabacum TaxID=4097 RepID=Q5M9T7_TOBAC|nr:hypothetical protein NitaMp138 [Nicotiana tabacum]UYX57478.1 hypothetical protein [Nicotiana tabacum]BAD83541.1 hypothetical protein [Nicotiana tabacum]